MALRSISGQGIPVFTGLHPRTLYNALFHDGVVLDDKEAHTRIEIVGYTGKSFRLRVTR